MKRNIINILRKFVFKVVPELLILSKKKVCLGTVSENVNNTKIGEDVKIYPPCNISGSTVNDYTYIAQNSCISKTYIGKFCSIGPNLLCGWGIHPINGISSHPMFYSTLKQNGMTLSPIDKVQERKEIHIGNDVFIGANVTILDGVKIGSGAVIGAGSIVSKDIPDYAIAVGAPIKVIKYRFDDVTINKLLKLKWWDIKKDQLKLIEKYFFDVDELILKLEVIANYKQT